MQAPERLTDSNFTPHPVAINSVNMPEESDINTVLPTVYLHWKLKTLFEKVGLLNLIFTGEFFTDIYDFLCHFILKYGED